VSVVLHPQRDVLSLVTIAAGVAVADGIDAATGLRTTVKWPNDVFVGARKLAGILAEGGSSHPESTSSWALVSMSARRSCHRTSRRERPRLRVSLVDRWIEAWFWRMSGRTREAV
jgi:hypothetical protein